MGQFKHRNVVTMFILTGVLVGLYRKVMGPSKTWEKLLLKQTSEGEGHPPEERRDSRWIVGGASYPVERGFALIKYYISKYRYRIL